MSITAERMIYWLRKELGGLDENDLPEEDALELLNTSLWALEDAFPFRAKEKAGTISLVDGTASYALTTLTNLDYIASISITDDAGESHKLSRMTRDWYDANYESEEVGLPTRYLRQGNDLIVYPTPDSDNAFDMNIVFRQSIADIGPSATSSGLPRNWDEIVVAGAAWRGHKANGDYNIAQQAANFQIGLIRAAVPTEAKEEKDSRYARLNVIWDFPEDQLEGHER